MPKLKTPFKRAFVCSLLCLAVAGCGACSSTPEMSEETAPVQGFVVDIAAFDAFIATRPTPEQFRARYPDVQLVLPGVPATKELRFNNSRYFAVLDESGRITGGRFG